MPIGLISSNYENTKIEWWADPNTFATCGLRDRQSFLFNSMIAPFATGPMQIAGWLFYQGEANTFDRQHAFGPSKQGRGGNVAAYDCTVASTKDITCPLLAFAPNNGVV